MDNITTYQAKYLANYLTHRLPANDINKFTEKRQSLNEAQDEVDAERKHCSPGWNVCSNRRLNRLNYLQLDGE